MYWWQLIQGGSKVRQPCQSAIVGGACAELRHSDRNLRTVWFEKRDFKTGIKKKTGIFIIIGWMCTLHFQHTFLFKTTCKVNLASDDPFNKTCSKLSLLWQKLRPHYSQSVKNVSNQFRPYNWIIKPCFFSIKQACDLLETKKKENLTTPKHLEKIYIYKKLNAAFNNNDSNTI